jgi:VWFA-related protein
MTGTRARPLLLVPLALLCAAHLRAQAQPGYVERVEVTRLLVDVRVVDDGGRPITGLGVDDFAVRVGGRPARVDTVEWVGAGDAFTPAGDDDAMGSSEGGEWSGAVGAGRLVVFLFQKSVQRGRIEGLMQMLRDTQALFETFTPGDRVAVLSFDSHLTVWLDFTADVQRVRRIFDRAVLFGDPMPVRPSAGPSLLARLTPAQARRTYSIEDALRRIAEALEPLPGAKSLVFVGHGFGELSLSGVSLRPSYDRARAALQAARTSVFTLDVTYADYHSLETGLQAVAEDSGGFFARTHLFPAQALSRLAGALAGHYVLFVEQPPLRPGVHGVDVRVKGRGTVLASRNQVVTP